MNESAELAAMENALEASIQRDSFADFAAAFWALMTGRPFEPNHATTAIIAALQAVADGTITRLLVAIPPGCGKSTLLALFAAWRLARNPGWRSIHACHAFGLAATESRRVRRLVEGDVYRARFAEVVLRSDENTVDHWSTTSDGRYFAIGSDGALTGRRAHEAVLDDPLNAPDRFSKAARDALWSWFCEALSTRLDGDRAPIIVVQQRLDRDDLIGKLLASGEPWTLLELPALAVSARRCSIPGVWTDPREVDGELLAPNVLSAEKLEGLKGLIGSAAFTAQYQQHPTDDSSAVIKRAWWRFYRPELVASDARRPDLCDTTRPAVERPERFTTVTLACDLTFGSATGDYAVCQAWGASGGGRYLLEQWRARAGFEDSISAIAAMAARYPGCKVIVEKAANGAAVIETLQKRITGVIAIKPIGKKLQRLSAIAPAVESGACFLPLGAPWLGDFVEELAGATSHDDAMDACAYAVHDLAQRTAGHGDNHGGFSSEQYADDPAPGTNELGFDL